MKKIAIKPRMHVLMGVVLLFIMVGIVQAWESISSLLVLRTSNSPGTELHFELLFTSIVVSLTNPLGVGVNNFPIYYSTYFGGPASDLVHV